MEVVERHFGDYYITTDRNKMDIVAIHDFLSKHSGWSDSLAADLLKRYI